MCIRDSFGIAQTGEALHLPTEGPIGTQLFMSPEQRDNQEIDGRSDLYSVGVTLYVMAVGLLSRERPSQIRRLLIQGLDPIAKAAEAMNGELARIIDRCMEEDPDDRFGSVAELESALEAIEHLVEPLVSTVTGAVSELPPRDIVRRARTRMISLNREESDHIEIDRTMPVTPVPLAPKVAPKVAPEESAEREAASAVGAGPNRKPILVASLALLLVTLVGGYAMTGEVPGKLEINAAGDGENAVAAQEARPPAQSEQAQVKPAPMSVTGEPDPQRVERPAPKESGEPHDFDAESNVGSNDGIDGASPVPDLVLAAGRFRDEDAEASLDLMTDPEVSPGSTVSRDCLLYTSPSPRDLSTSRMPSSA